MFNLKKFFLLWILAISYLPLTFAKVDPPNYNFSLDDLKVFFPGTDLTEITKKYGAGEKIESVQGNQTLKFYIAQIRYKFPVYVQVKNGKVLDMFAKLPSYFSHDIYHQSLINRFGNQSEYQKQENHAIYKWKNKMGVDIIYSGACTITCFPIYMTVTASKKKGETANFKSLLTKFSKNFSAKLPN